MLNVLHFRDFVVAPTLQRAGLWSEAAEKLVVGTAVYESGLIALRQYDGGPAMGLFQIEPATHKDLWKSYLVYKPYLWEKIENAVIGITIKNIGLIPYHELFLPKLITDMAYGTVICRLLYYRHPERLPEAADIEGLASYYKKYYNTPQGAGSVEGWIKAYEKYLANIYKGFA